jgi:hypothetical protein
MPYMNSIYSKIHGPAEHTGLAGTLIGLVMKVLHIAGAGEILMLSMSVLSVAYLIRAFMPATGPESSRRGTLDLFGGTIVPRISMIACSVVVAGILFEILHLEGGNDMRLIGCGVLATGIALAIVFLMRDREKYRFFIGYLFRMVPVFLFGI